MSLEGVFQPSGQILRSSVVERAKEINTRLPMVNPHCEAKVVVPVYREFENGRIINLLEELQAQDIGSQRFEVVLVVNNPPSSDASGLKGLIDNIELLEYFKKQKQSGSFSNTHVLDCTRGEIPKRHMGLVRGLGQLVAEERLDKTNKGDQGVIVQLDADVSIDPDFLSNLLRSYQNPNVRSAMIGRIPLPIDFLSDDYYTTYASYFAFAAEAAVKNGGYIGGDGPILSLRSELHKKESVRDYIGANINEDFALSDSLSNEGGMYLLAEPRVYKGDRIRPDGFDSAVRHGWVSTQATWTTVDVLLRNAFKGTSFSKGQFDSMPQTEFWAMVKDTLRASNPVVSDPLDETLAREEQLARRSLDWDNLNPQLRAKAHFLFAFSRLALGENQMAALPPKAVDPSQKANSFIKDIQTDKNLPSDYSLQTETIFGLRKSPFEKLIKPQFLEDDDYPSISKDQGLIIYKTLFDRYRKYRISPYTNKE